MSDSREAAEARAKADASRVELQTLAEEGCTGEHGDHHTDDCPTDDHYDCSCPQHVADRACNAVDGLNRVVATLRAERDAAVAERDATRSRLDEAERHLGVVLRHFAVVDAVSGALSAEAVAACDVAHAFLAASQPSPSTPVPLETGGGGKTPRPKADGSASTAEPLIDGVARQHWACDV